MSVDVEAIRADLLRRRLNGVGATERPTLPRADRNGPLPLSFGQQQMWFLSRLEPESWEYVVPIALRLTGPLDVPALRGATFALNCDPLPGQHDQTIQTRHDE